MKAVVAAFNQEKALEGAFSVITNLRMELFQALKLNLCGRVKSVLTNKINLHKIQFTRYTMRHFQVLLDNER